MRLDRKDHPWWTSKGSDSGRQRRGAPRRLPRPAKGEVGRRADCDNPVGVAVKDEARDTGDRLVAVGGGAEKVSEDDVAVRVPDDAGWFDVAPIALLLGAARHRRPAVDRAVAGSGLDAVQVN